MTSQNRKTPSGQKQDHFLLESRLRVIEAASSHAKKYIEYIADHIKGTNPEDHIQFTSDVAAISDIVTRITAIMPSLESGAADAIQPASDIYDQWSRADEVVERFIRILSNQSYVNRSTHNVSATFSRDIQRYRNSALDNCEKYFSLSAEDDDAIIQEYFTRIDVDTNKDKIYLWIMNHKKSINKFTINLITACIRSYSSSGANAKQRSLELLIEDQKNHVLGSGGSAIAGDDFAASRIDLSQWQGSQGLVSRYGLIPLVESAPRHRIFRLCGGNYNYDLDLDANLRALASRGRSVIFINNALGRPVEFDLRALTDSTYIQENDLEVSPSSGLTNKVLKKYATAKMIVHRARDEVPLTPALSTRDDVSTPGSTSKNDASGADIQHSYKINPDTQQQERARPKRDEILPLCTTIYPGSKTADEYHILETIDGTYLRLLGRPTDMGTPTTNRDGGYSSHGKNNWHSRDKNGHSNNGKSTYPHKANPSKAMDTRDMFVDDTSIRGLIHGLSPRAKQYNEIQSRNLFEICLDPGAALILQNYEEETQQNTLVSSEPATAKIATKLNAWYLSELTKQKPTSISEAKRIAVDRTAIGHVMSDVLVHKIGTRGRGSIEYSLSYLARIESISNRFTREMEQQLLRDKMNERTFAELSESDLRAALSQLFTSCMSFAFAEMERTSAWTSYDNSLKGYFLDAKSAVV